MEKEGDFDTAYEVKIRTKKRSEGENEEHIPAKLERRIEKFMGEEEITQWK